MRRNSGDLVFEPEIERFLRKVRSEKRKEKEKEKQVEENFEIEEEEEIEESMAQPRVTLEDLTSPNVNGCNSSISPPTVPANNFEIKPALI